MNRQLFALAADAYALFRRCVAEAANADAETAAAMLAEAREAEQIGARLWSRAVRS